ncbi:MAG: choice-of-anchor J domain-containing protein, partial [Clostridia bacterium]|nr:choice-of-anchor J domain-containing protein [Clostridia bacterium]
MLRSLGGKRLFAFLLTFAMLLIALPLSGVVTVSAVETSGTIDIPDIPFQVEWDCANGSVSYDSSAGKLTLTATATIGDGCEGPVAVTPTMSIRIVNVGDSPEELKFWHQFEDETSILATDPLLNGTVSYRGRFDRIVLPGEAVTFSYQASPIQGADNAHYFSDFSLGTIHATRGENIDFEDRNPLNNGWEARDKDSEAGTWVYEDLYGVHCMIDRASSSVDSDDWLISAPFSKLKAGLQHYIHFTMVSTDPNCSGDELVVYATTDKSDLGNMRVISGRIQTKPNMEPSCIYLDISAFSGEETVYIGFRHWYSKDKAGIAIADLVLVAVPAKTYAINVDGVPVTSLNQYDILGNGVFSFDGCDTLAIHGDYTGQTDNPLLAVDMQTYIYTTKESHLTSAKSCVDYSGNLNFRGNKSLTLTCTGDNPVIVGNTRQLLYFLDADVTLEGGSGGGLRNATGIGDLWIFNTNLAIKTNGAGIALAGFMGDIRLDSILDSNSLLYKAGGYVEKVSDPGSYANDVTFSSDHTMTVSGAVTGGGSSGDVIVITLVSNTGHCPIVAEALVPGDGLNTLTHEPVQYQFENVEPGWYIVKTKLVDKDGNLLAQKNYPE